MSLGVGSLRQWPGGGAWQIPGRWHAAWRRWAPAGGRLAVAFGLLVAVYVLDRGVLDSPSVSWLAYALPVLLAPRLLPVPAAPLVLIVATALSWLDSLAVATAGWEDVWRALLLVGVGLYALRDAERERELEAAKARLLRLVSHELRTPLHHIKGFASTLLQPDVDWDPPSQRACLEAIEQSCDRLTQLVEALLEMARLADGRLCLQRRACAPATLVASAVEQVRPALAQHPLQLDLSTDLPPVWVDPLQTERVLANLLDNAAKYSPPGSPIQVRAAPVGDGVVIDVADQGSGVHPAERQRIFERFQRGSAAGTSPGSGVGLGLALAREIVAAHGGRIWVRPNRPRGSVFAVWLPTGPATGRVGNERDEE